MIQSVYEYNVVDNDVCGGQLYGVFLMLPGKTDALKN